MVGFSFGSKTISSSYYPHLNFPRATKTTLAVIVYHHVEEVKRTHSSHAINRRHKTAQKNCPLCSSTETGMISLMVGSLGPEAKKDLTAIRLDKACGACATYILVHW